MERSLINNQGQTVSFEDNRYNKYHPFSNIVYALDFFQRTLSPFFSKPNYKISHKNFFSDLCGDTCNKNTLELMLKSAYFYSDKNINQKELFSMCCEYSFLGVQFGTSISFILSGISLGSLFFTPYLLQRFVGVCDLTTRLLYGDKANKHKNFIFSKDSIPVIINTLYNIEKTNRNPDQESFADKTHIAKFSGVVGSISLGAEASDYEDPL